MVLCYHHTSFSSFFSFPSKWMHSEFLFFNILGRCQKIRKQDSSNNIIFYYFAHKFNCNILKPSFMGTISNVTNFFFNSVTIKLEIT